MTPRLKLRALWALMLLPLLLLAGSDGEAQDVARLYSKAELLEIGARYEPNIRLLWNQNLLANLTSSERAKVSQVALKLPLFGVTRNPVEYYSNPDARQVVLPIASVKFLDDMSMAFAFFDKNGCDMGAVSDYAAALRFRGEGLTSSPLTALGVPASAFDDAYVDDVAQKALKSTLLFVTAHEYAHVMYRHEGYSMLTAEEAQKQETEADLFGLEIMRRVGVPPIAMAQFFLIASRLEASPGDFTSLADYEAYLHEEATHPVSARRLLNVAEAIDRNADAFARLQRDPGVVSGQLRNVVAPQLRAIAGTLDDRRMRLFLAQQAKKIDIAALRTACRRQ